MKRIARRLLTRGPKSGVEFSLTLVFPIRFSSTYEYREFPFCRCMCRGMRPLTFSTIAGQTSWMHIMKAHTRAYGACVTYIN